METKNKRFWMIVLILSSILFFILMMPWLEVFGLNMPFVQIKDPVFNIFGFDIPNEKQIGVMMMAGVLMMLPVRTIHLSIIKLS
jgi:hypothetical protein